MSLKKWLFKMGIDIKFVTKEEKIDPLEYNSLENLNKMWEKVKNKETYLSEEYKQLYYKLEDIIKQYKIDINNKKIVDLGCGMGIMLSILNDKYQNLQIYGFDASSTAIEIAQKQLPKGKFKVFDIYEPNHEKYDVLFCMEVLEHLLYPETAMKNIIERMHKNSILLLTVPDGRKDTWLGHINFWSPESWNIFIERTSNGIPFVTGQLTDSALYAILGNGIN
jgi:2-polyprenyl-3-methyl-5-hydroxy-6-metoxy-1,4-benzoquinol methylase